MDNSMPTLSVDSSQITSAAPTFVSISSILLMDCNYHDSSDVNSFVTLPAPQNNAQIRLVLLSLDDGTSQLLIRDTAGPIVWIAGIGSSLASNIDFVGYEGQWIMVSCNNTTGASCVVPPALVLSTGGLGGQLAPYDVRSEIGNIEVTINTYVDGVLSSTDTKLSDDLATTGYSFPVSDGHTYSVSIVVPTQCTLCYGETKLSNYIDTH